ncbi:MAG: anti-sigma factor antagonist [Isosphaeraceae bacterium]|nr:anti-sigma factor antagonist [Isosphaeraceae bacterium]
MPLNVNFIDDVAVLSNIARSMNDPRYVDAGREVGEVVDQGCKRFVIELRSVRETGSPLLGVLMTMTREIRRQGGEVVLGDVSKSVKAFLTEMRMDDYWDLFDSVQEAVESFRPRSATRSPEIR